MDFENYKNRCLYKIWKLYADGLGHECSVTGNKCDLLNCIEFKSYKINNQIIDEQYSEKGFKVICMNCGSNDVFIETDIDYDWDENPYECGYYLRCNNCGSTDER